MRPGKPSVMSCQCLTLLSRFPRIAVNHEKIIREKLDERNAQARQNQQIHQAQAANSQVRPGVANVGRGFIENVSRITQRKRKKRERLLRGVSLGLHQDLRRAETETGIETDLVRRKGPNRGLAPGPGKERRKATRETDPETETGHETDTIETDITETGETTDVTGTRTTLTSCDDTKRIPAGTRNTAGNGWTATSCFTWKYSFRRSRGRS